MHLAAAPHPYYPAYYHIPPAAPPDTHLKRQYLGLLPPEQIIEICLAFDVHVPPYIKGSVWPVDLGSAIATLQKQRDDQAKIDASKESEPIESENGPPLPSTSEPSSESSESTPTTETTESSAPKPPPPLEEEDEDEELPESVLDAVKPSQSSSTVSSESSEVESSSSATATTNDAPVPDTTPSSAESAPAPPPATTPAPSAATPTPIPGNPPPPPPPPPGYPPYMYPHPHPQAAYPHSPYYTPPPGYPYPYSYHPQPTAVPPNQSYPPQTTPYAPPPNPYAPPPPTPIRVGVDGEMEDLPSYEDMLVEALQEHRDPEGCAPKDLFAWMAAKYPLQSNFRPSASQALQKAYKRGRFEKGSNGKYRLSATWEGGSSSRRTTRRPQVQNASIAPPPPPVPQNSSPFTHAPLVHHHQAYNGYSYGPPGYVGYGHHATGNKTTSAPPAQTTAPVAPPTAGAPSTSTAPPPGVDPDHHADTYEAAKAILNAINSAGLLQFPSEDGAKDAAPTVPAPAAAQPTAPAQMNGNGVEHLLSQLQSALAANAAASQPLAGAPAFGAPLAAPPPPQEEPRAELQAQMALLAAQLADFAGETHVPSLPLPGAVPIPGFHPHPPQRLFTSQPLQHPGMAHLPPPPPVMQGLQAPTEETQARPQPSRPPPPPPLSPPAPPLEEVPVPIDPVLLNGGRPSEAPNPSSPMVVDPLPSDEPVSSSEQSSSEVPTSSSEPPIATQDEQLVDMEPLAPLPQEEEESDESDDDMEEVI